MCGERRPREPGQAQNSSSASSSSSSRRGNGGGGHHFHHVMLQHALRSSLGGLSGLMSTIGGGPFPLNIEGGHGAMFALPSSLAELNRMASSTDPPPEIPRTSPMTEQDIKWREEFIVNSQVEALDQQRVWLPAEIIQVREQKTENGDETQFLLHFIGHNARWDFWVSKNSNNIREPGTGDGMDAGNLSIDPMQVFGGGIEPVPAEERTTPMTEQDKNWRQELQVGCTLLAFLAQQRRWLPAQVKEIKAGDSASHASLDSMLFLHFTGTHTRWDVWVRRDSTSIRDPRPPESDRAEPATPEEEQWRAELHVGSS
jgi:hypothetical protein